MPRLPLVLLGAWLLALGGCRQRNESHCAWQDDPGASCVARTGGARPLCSRCTATNDGCVAESELDEGCLVAAGGMESGETGSSGSATESTGSTDSSTSGGTDESTQTGGPDCGNAMIDPGESCDGDDLNGKSCEDLGRPPGELACDQFCGFDLSGCCKPNGSVCEADDDCCSGKCDMLVTNKCTSL